MIYITSNNPVDLERRASLNMLMKHILKASAQELINIPMTILYKSIKTFTHQNPNIFSNSMRSCLEGPYFHIQDLNYITKYAINLLQNVRIL